MLYMHVCSYGNIPKKKKALPPQLTREADVQSWQGIRAKNSGVRQSKKKMKFE